MVRTKEVAAQPKRGLGDLNFILVQSPGFFCWMDMVVDHNNTDHLTEDTAYRIPLQWPTGAKIEDIKKNLCKFYKNAFCPLAPDPASG